MNKTYRGMYFIDVDELKESANKKNSCGIRARRKLAILTRDDFKCKICGTTEKLTIAHIVPYQNQKRNTASYPLKLCKVLCVDCHKKEDFGG